MRRILRSFTFALAVSFAAFSALADGVSVDVKVGASGLDADDVKRAIDAELASSSGALSGTLDVELTARRHAVVSFRSASGRVTKREIDLPDEPKRAKETIALLAGNLGRDEASEILAELDRERAKSAPAAPAEEAKPEPAPETPPPPPKVAPSKPAAAPDRQQKSNPQKEPEHDAAALPGFIANASLTGDIALISNAPHRHVNLEFGVVSEIGSLGGAMFGLGYGHIVRDAEGAVFELGYARTGRKLRGFAFGVGATRSGELRGVQAAAGVNLIDGEMQGASGALVNSAGAVTGAQIALVNVGGRVKGLQAGLVNIGGDVDGAQVGLVNVADRVDGVPLGIVNVIKNGRTQVVAWGDSAAYANAGIKYKNGAIYTLLGIGHAVTDSGRTHSSDMAASFAIGGEIPLAPSWLLGFDAMYAGETPSEFRRSGSEARHVARLRALIVFDPNQTVSGFAAVGGEEVTFPGGEVQVRPYAAAGLAFF